MVATDVASRGIGMNKKQSPSPSPPLLYALFCISYHCRRVVLVRALFARYASALRDLSRLCVLLGPFSGNLGFLFAVCPDPTF